MRRQIIMLILVVGSLLITGSCQEIPTSVKIENGPMFKLHGSGRLASFRIYGPRPGHKIATPFDSDSLIWRLQPAAGYLKGTLVEELDIKYGTVPNEYAQIVPSNGSAPVLAGRQVYYFFAETTNAPPAEGFFYLDGNVPTQIKVPGLCQSGFVGNVKPLKCGTNEPYIEPNNLEQFVHQNRVQR